MRRNILKENRDSLTKDILNWALGEAHKHQPAGRNINAMGLLYEYYYEDDDDALYYVAEEYSDMTGIDIDEVYEAARMAAIYYFNYNPDYEREEMKESCNVVKTMIESTIRKVLNEKRNKCSKLDMIIEGVINKQVQKLTEDDEKETKKHAVIQWLQKPEIDTAEIRRQVEGEPETQEEEDSKRSYFMKKVNQDYGKDFSDEEINRLYSLKSSLGQ